MFNHVLQREVGEDRGRIGGGGGQGRGSFATGFGHDEKQNHYNDNVKGTLSSKRGEYTVQLV